MLLVAALLLGIPGEAKAGATCGFMGGGAAFGPYDILSTAPTDTVALIQVRCDSVAPGNPNISVTMSIGAGQGGSVNNRRMLHTGGTADVLSYGLFRTASRSGVWGSTLGVDTETVTAKVQHNRSAEMTFTIYGRIHAQQDVTPGEYADTVQITLSF